MENMINIAEILKDCQGMELDCTLYNGVVTLEQVQPIHTYSIKIRVKCGDESFTNMLTKYGQTSPSPCNKCVIFPKGKTTWESFQRPFKDGDVVINDRGNIFIYKGLLYHDKNRVDFYCGYRTDDNAFVINESKDRHFGSMCSLRLATEKEKEKLFDAIKENGYRWDADTNTLRVVGELRKLKFKVGDVVQHDNYKVRITEVNTDDNLYRYESLLAKGIGGIPFDEENDWELSSNKFIDTFTPFKTKVLVRNKCGYLWKPAIFGYYIKNDLTPYCVVGGTCWRQCIPYDGNKHLLGTKDDCDEFYKNW